LKINSFGITDVGRKRTNNEDNFLIIPKNLFAVADGMGGYEYGERASQMAMELLENLYEVNNSIINDENITSIMSSWVEELNRQIYLENERKGSNMGTTIVVSLYRYGFLWVANVGDSRIYRLPVNSEIEQISRDHSLVAEQVRLGIITQEEADNHPNKNIITRALGVQYDVSVDTFKCKIEIGDFFIMCSDGLSNMVSDFEMEKVLANRSYSLEEKGKKLIDMANEAGGVDNITLIILEVVDD
jgi:serine/threonine protein phosphatase PrpC